MINKNKKIIAISLASLSILLIGLFIYRQPIKDYLRESRDRIAIVDIVKNFYTDYIQAINTNQGWPELVERYTANRASETISINAVFLMESALMGSQHLAQIASPILVRFFEVNPTQARVLVDFAMYQNVVGNPSKMAGIEKLLVFEKINNQWLITEDLDRSERFDSWANEQNFPSVQISK